MRSGIVLAGIVTTVVAFTAASFDNDKHHEFRVHMRGNNEVPAVDTETSGDFRIRFSDDFKSAKVRLEIEDGTRITQAHLHCGEEGVNGPVIVFIAGFHDRGWDIDGRWIDDVEVTDENIVNTSCGTTLRDIADAIENGRIYVNAHSVAHPGGEIRGQLGDDNDDDDDDHSGHGHDGDDD